MQIIWISNYLFLLLVGVHKLSNTSILVQIPTELTVHCSVSFMSCWAIQIMRRPSSNLLQWYFFDSNILDTVGSKMALLACNNPLEASTNPVEGTSTLSTAMGAQELVVKKAALGRE
jgi:uncharacterized membrane protein